MKAVYVSVSFFRRYLLVGANAVLPLPCPPMRTTAEGDQHFDRLEKLGNSIALPGFRTNRTFAFAVICITHISPISFRQQFATYRLAFSLGVLIVVHLSDGQPRKNSPEAKSISITPKFYFPMGVVASSLLD